jgi:hypothetical protein
VYNVGRGLKLTVLTSCTVSRKNNDKPKLNRKLNMT